MAKLKQKLFWPNLDEGGSNTGKELGLTDAHHGAGPLANLDPDIFRVNAGDHHLQREMTSLEFKEADAGRLSQREA